MARQSPHETVFASVNIWREIGDLLTDDPLQADEKGSRLNLGQESRVYPGVSMSLKDPSCFSFEV